MKVPIMYKSSDRFNAGTDVIYDDESKLQYAPYIYAYAESGDNGDSGGDDEEGEDVMIIQKDDDGVLNKSFGDIISAMLEGKSCVILYSGDFVFHEYVTACYDFGEDYLEAGAEKRYMIEAITSYTGDVSLYQYIADTATDNLVIHVGGWA